jgi:hypothetical protein
MVKISGKKLFDALRISTRNDNIDETVCDNVIDNSIICSNNIISKSRYKRCIEKCYWQSGTIFCAIL